MPDPVERVRGVIRQRLERLSGDLRAEFEAFLDDPPEPGSGRFDFEVNRFFYAVTDLEGQELLSDEQTAGLVDAEAVCREAGVEDEEFDYEELLAEMFMNWLADCWEEVGGAEAPYPAEAFFHDPLLDRFDFRRREWYRTDEAAGGE